MNDSQLTEFLRRVERDAPFPDPEHVRLRDEVLAHFDHVRGVADGSESARPADEPDVPAEVGGPHAIGVSPRRRVAPLVAAAAAVVLGVASFVVWTSAGGDGRSDRLIPADSGPATGDVSPEPFGPVGTTSAYDVARDGVAQGTLELTVEDNDMPDASRQVTTLSARLTPPDADGGAPLGVVSFEITDAVWNIPVSLGRLSGSDWPDCADAVVAVPRVGPATSVQTLDCDGVSVSATTTTDGLGDRLEALISLQSVDDEYQMRVAGADGRLEQMVIELSTTVDLIDTE